MARPTRPRAENPRDGRIEDIDVSEEMRGSFLEYAYSVIYSRALPDARDGLKPVQRRILFQMSEMGLRPERGHVKSARVVGDVMGKLHPHGEGAIYDALVRMAQDFTLRLPMVDGHGNFGSLDDGPAASRYTECRMAPGAVSMTASLDEDVVDFVPNYDGRESEPIVLPAAIPALLVNGTTGIAVGMATNCAPHNLGEVIGAARHLIEHPKASLDDLMRFVPGPDLPGGGKIVGLDGIRDAYETGRGSFRMRATTKIEQVSPRRRGIVVTELPYMVGVERVMEKIKDLHNSKKIVGIAGMTDLTDGDNGLHLVIEVKNGVNAEALLTELYRLTPLEESFNVNAVALVDGTPETLGLKRALEVFVAHRFEVVRRRSEYRRRKAQDRLHLVDGLLVAILDIDEVIQLIRSSDDAAEAKARLISVFDLSEIQAQYILDMPLRRLTKFSRLELESERDELQRTIDALTEILEDEAMLRRVVSDELAEVAAAHATPRRTVLLASTGESLAARVTASDLEVADDPCWVMLSGTGLLARTSERAELPADGPRTSHDVMAAVVPASARGEVAVVTSAGRVHRVSVIDLPAVPITAGPVSAAGGAPLGEFVSLEPDEAVVGLMPLTPAEGAEGEADAPGVLALGTSGGVVKRVAVEALRNKDVWEVIALKDGDRVVGAAMCTDADELAFVTSDAQLLRFAASAVRAQGRTAGGMAGIRLAAGASVVWFGAVNADDGSVLVTMAGALGQLPGTSTGAVKVTELAAYPAKGRGTAGVRCMRLGKGQDAVLMAWAGRGPARASGSGGVDVGLPAPDQKRDGSGTAAGAPIACLGGTPHVPG